MSEVFRVCDAVSVGVTVALVPLFVACLRRVLGAALSSRCARSIGGFVSKRLDRARSLFSGERVLSLHSEVLKGGSGGTSLPCVAVGLRTGCFIPGTYRNVAKCRFAFLGSPVVTTRCTCKRKGSV